MIFYRLILVLTLCLPLGSVAADFLRQVIEGPPAFEARNLIETSAGELLVHTMHREGELHLLNAPVAEYLRLNQQGQVAAAYRVPNVWPSAIPFGEEFVFRRPAERVRDSALQSYQIVARSRKADVADRVLYVARDVFQSIQVRPALDQKSLYLTEQRTNHVWDLVRIDRDGRELFRKRFEDVEVSALLAVPDGVVLVQWIGYSQPRKSPGQEIVAFANDGAIRWKTSHVRPSNVSMEQFVFQTPSMIASLQSPSGLTGPWRLMRIDAANGSFLGSTEVAPVHGIRSTPNGLLLYGNVAGRPYVSLLNSSGNEQWSRRVPMHEDYAGTLFDATITASGELVLLGAYDMRNPADPLWSGQSVGLVRAEGGMPPPTPQCLDVDSVEIAKLERRIEARHAIDARIVRGHYDERPSLCTTPDDAAYLGFLRELEDALGSEPTADNRWDFRVYLRVTPTTKPRTLTRYSVDSLISDAPRTSVSYDVSVAAAKNIAAYVRGTLMPHIKKMEGASAQFREFTGVPLTVDLQEGKYIGDPELFAKLEIASKSVLDATRRLAPALPKQRHRSLRNLFVELKPDGFGRMRNVRPLNEAVETIEQVFVAP